VGRGECLRYKHDYRALPVQERLCIEAVQIYAEQRHSVCTHSGSDVHMPKVFRHHTGVNRLPIDSSVVNNKIIKTRNKIK